MLLAGSLLRARLTQGGGVGAAAGETFGLGCWRVRTPRPRRGSVLYLEAGVTEERHLTRIGKIKALYSAEARSSCGVLNSWISGRWATCR